MNLDNLIMKASDYTPAKKYLQDRLIPEGFINDIYANPDCSVLWGDETLEPETSTGIMVKAGIEWAHGQTVPLGNEPRIVFPYRDLSSNLVGFTTRSILDSVTDGMRYQGRRLTTDAKMVYNQDRIDTSKTIFVCESELDSAFLPNACATCDWTQLDTSWKSMAVLVYDNDDLADKIGKQEAIADGWIVVDWAGKTSYKDINEMILGGMTTPQIVALIQECI